MQAQYRTSFFSHHLLANGNSLTDIFHGRRRHRRKNAGSTMQLMGFHRLAKSLLGTLGKVVSSPSMRMHTNIPGDNEHTACIHLFSTHQSQITISHFNDLSVFKQDGSVFYPTLWSKYLTINYLSQHTIRSLQGLSSYKCIVFY